MQWAFCLLLKINQIKMIAQRAHELLFQLTLTKIDCVFYYALLAVAALSLNPKIETIVLRSRTLDKVDLFLRTLDPIQFGKTDYFLTRRQSAVYLGRLEPLLRSNREEVQTLIAFHFAVEGSILRDQRKLEVCFVQSCMTCTCFVLLSYVSSWWIVWNVFLQVTSNIEGKFNYLIVYSMFDQENITFECFELMNRLQCILIWNKNWGQI